MSAVALAVLLAAAPALAGAGPYGDEMGKCLVNKSSPQDRTLLIKWMFAVMALHPDVQSLSAVSAQQREAITRSAGELFDRLLLESCRTETRQAIQNEGLATIDYAFQILGQVAMRGLMGDSHVSEGLKDLGKSMDESKLKELMPASGKSQ